MNNNSKEYQEFLKENPGQGFLNIRVYAANQAVPVSNLKIVVSKNFNGENLIFYEGYTDSSGATTTVSLPTPKLNSNDLTIPSGITYDILATLSPNVSKKFTIEIYENISVLQNINISLINDGDSNVN